MPVLLEKREARLGAFADCLILLGEKGEVQDFLNFSLRRIGVFAILRALSGEKEGAENYELWKWYTMRYERQR